MGFIPIIIVGKLRGIKSAAILAVLFFVISSLNGNVFSLVWTAFVLKGILFGLLFVELLNRKIKFFTFLLISITPTILYDLLLVLNSSLKMEFKAIIDSQFDFLKQSLENELLLNSNTLDLIIKLVPSTEIIQAIINVSIIFIVINRKRLFKKCFLCDFKVDEWFIWVLIGSLFLSITGLYFELGINILIISAFIYLLQGVSIVRSYYSVSNKVVNFGEIVFYLVQLFVWGVPLIIIGFIDNWWDLRSKINILKNKNKDNKEF